MPKRISKPRTRKAKRDDRPTDVNQLARHLVDLSTQEPPMPTKDQISQVMAMIGRKGGRIGGKARLVTMTAEERSQAGLKAAQGRWKNRPTKQQ